MQPPDITISRTLRLTNQEAADKVRDLFEQVDAAYRRCARDDPRRDQLRIQAVALECAVEVLERASKYGEPAPQTAPEASVCPQHRLASLLESMRKVADSIHSANHVGREWQSCSNSICSTIMEAITNATVAPCPICAGQTTERRLVPR